MTGNAALFHQNFISEKKTPDVVEKDIRKWVESVAEFKANMDKQKEQLPPSEKHLKKMKKVKLKKKSSKVTMSDAGVKDPSSGQQKSSKSKKGVKKTVNSTVSEKAGKKEQLHIADAFDIIKENYKNLKLPPNWTSGLSGNRLVFNRIKVTTHNAQQKMIVEKSLVITKNRNVHVLVNGSEIIINNWEAQKVDTLDDIRKIIKEIDSLKFCEGLQHGKKSPQCSVTIDGALKICEACKSESVTLPKTITKKPRSTKRTGRSKGVSKQ